MVIINPLYSGYVCLCVGSCAGSSNVAVPSVDIKVGRILKSRRLQMFKSRSNSQMRKVLIQLETILKFNCFLSMVYTTRPPKSYGGRKCGHRKNICENQWSSVPPLSRPVPSHRLVLRYRMWDWSCQQCNLTASLVSLFRNMKFF
jgi:hypothetical protein